VQINVYNQLAAFYEKIWSNPKMKAQHSALYWFLVNQANRQRWPEWFTVPRDIAMNGAKISKRETYYNAVKVLVESGLIEYTKSTNQYEAPHFKLISLSRKRVNQGDKQGSGTGSSKGLAGAPYKDTKTLKHKDSCSVCSLYNPEVGGYGYCGDDFINGIENPMCVNFERKS
jgi:hypothetical protein